MVQSMTEAATVPHFHFCDEVNMGPLLRVRSVAVAANPAGPRLTFLPFVVKVNFGCCYWLCSIFPHIRVCTPCMQGSCKVVSTASRTP